eukprot:7783741-Pyramimonas_sp.AAC.1
MATATAAAAATATLPRPVRHARFRGEASAPKTRAAIWKGVKKCCVCACENFAPLCPCVRACVCA